MPQMPSSFQPLSQQPSSFQPVTPDPVQTPAQVQMPSSFQPVPQENIPQGNPLKTPAPTVPLEPAHIEPIPNVAVPSHNQEQNRGFVHQVFDTARDVYQRSPIAPLWDMANTPLFTMGLEKGNVPVRQQEFRQDHPIASVPFDFTLNTMNTIATPLNIATAGTGALAKYTGLGAFNTLTKMLSVPVGIEGTVNLLDPHATPGQRMAGALELWGARQGLKSKIEVPANKIPSIPVSAVAPALNQPDFIFSNYIRDIGKVKQGMPHRIILDTISKEITNKLSDLGYRPGGRVDAGQYEGRLYMVWEAPKPSVAGKPVGKGRELYNLSRGLTTTWDMSAPLRQGAPMVLFKQWWTSLDDMVRAWGSEDAYKVIQKSIDDHPYFQKKVEHDWRIDTKTGEMEWLPKDEQSFAQKAGLSMTDLNNWTSKEELIMSNWAEKLPGARRSNRAYTAFLNKLRADTFIDLVDRQKSILGRELTEGEAKQIATFINDATGRGKLTTAVPVLRRNAAGKLRKFDVAEFGPGHYGPMVDELATDVLFSPKLAYSRIRMLNPFTYLDPKLSPMVRKQYLKAALGEASVWMTANTLGYLTGGEQSINPTNADFGKIKYGNMRIDPGAGFQQFLVEYARMISATTTSSTTGNVRELGQGYNAPTLRSTTEDFAINKLHPVPKFIADIVSATSERPVQVGDRILQMYVPLVMQDLADLVKDSMKPGGQKNLPPEVAALVLSYFGMGSQVYGTAGESSNFLIPPKYDYTHKGGMLPGMEFAISHVIPQKYQREFKQRRTR